MAEWLPGLSNTFLTFSASLWNANESFALRNFFFGYSDSFDDDEDDDDDLASLSCFDELDDFSSSSESESELLLTSTYASFRIRFFPAVSTFAFAFGLLLDDDPEKSLELHSFFTFF